MALTKVRGDGVQGMSLLSSSTALSIDASGRLTTTSQVYARMSKTDDQTINGWTKITDFTATGTTSSAFNTTNQRFTVPISGRYLVDTRVHYGGAVGYNYTGFYINGSADNYNSGSNITWGSDTTIGGSQIIDLSANDYIELYAYANVNVTISGDDNLRTYFVVMLLG